MSAKKIKKKTVERGKYKTYLKKAGEFYDTMLQAKEKRRWNAMGLNAIHCCMGYDLPSHFQTD